MTPRRAARLTRREAQERTRELLLEAAARVFAWRGFSEATLEEIAREAGYTTGAVYSNFPSKEELFRAAFAHQVTRDIELVIAARETAEGSPAEATRATARTWMELVRDRPEMFLLLIEQWFRAMREPEQRPVFNEHFQRMLDATTKWVVEEAQRSGYELRVPPEHVAIGALAMPLGMAIEYMADPDSVPEDLLEALGLAYFAGLRSSPADPE